MRTGRGSSAREAGGAGFRWRVAVSDDAVVVRLEGEFDLAVADALREALDALVAKHPEQDLVLDLAGVSFIDSSGLGVILGRHRRLQARGRRLLLAGVGPQVKGILTTAGLGRILPLDERPAPGR
ncbi:MAG: STAS domain-containing protein [Actinomycetia bacterium]|nr:STAS domain-containing protein [Actinomycetes bacterium]